MNMLLPTHSGQQLDGGSFPRSARRTGGESSVAPPCGTEGEDEVGFVPVRNAGLRPGAFTCSRGRQSALISPGRSMRRLTSAATLAFAILGLASLGFAKDFSVLEPAAFAHHVEHFNTMEDENVTNFVSNAASWDWLRKNIPFFECPDREVEEIYYFRWWSFRKHLVQTTNGVVFTEFLTPVKHAGIYNTISCAAGFHLAEGRWLRDQGYLDDYIRFWLRGNAGKPQPDRKSTRLNSSHR